MPALEIHPSRRALKKGESLLFAAEVDRIYRRANGDTAAAIKAGILPAHKRGERHLVHPDDAYALWGHR